MFKISRLFNLMLIFTALALILTGCTKPPIQEEQSQNTKQFDEPLTIVDSYGNEVVLNEVPVRVISIAPSITETLFTLDLEEYLVGRTDYCDFPLEAKNIESIGTLTEPNIEQIVRLEPDLIIASTHFKEDTMKKLSELNFKVMVLDPRDSFEGVYNTIEKLGKVFDINDKSQNLIRDMKQRVATVLDTVKDQKKPHVYYAVGFGEGGDYTAGGDTFINDMIEMAGGINAAKDIKGWKYSIERLVEQDPDILIVAEGDNSKEAIKEANGYKELTAVKEGMIYEIDRDLLERQGPRLAEGLEKLAKIIHPKSFE